MSPSAVIESGSSVQTYIEPKAGMKYNVVPSTQSSYVPVTDEPMLFCIW
jgi:hypothetical protein